MTFPTTSQYYHLREAAPGRIVRLQNLTDKHGRYVVKLNPNILESDDNILAVIAHEVFEIELLEQAFHENGGQLEAKFMLHLIDGNRGEAHRTAWDYSDKLIGDLQQQGKYP